MPDDAPGLIRMYHHLSAQTRKYRFHENTGNVTDEVIEKEANRLSQVDFEKNFAAISVLKTTGEILGVGRFAVNEDGLSAETAIVIRDDYQRRGLGRQLLKILLHEAHRREIKKFTATVLGENDHIISFLKKIPLDKKYSYQEGSVQIVVPIPDNVQELLNNDLTIPLQENKSQ
jgi:acetyltransferase